MLEMRTITPEEFAQWLRAEARAHGNRLDHDPEELRPHFDLDRSIAVFDQGNIIGGAHSHRLEMSIPGGSAVVAGVANVAVQPTHRRQGVMTRMMRHQIKDIHERGEPLAALFASESIIYGRFGYGIGSLYERWVIERQYNAYARPYESPGRIVFVDPEDITKELPEIFRRSTMDRPGVFQRPFHQWERDSQAPEHRQGGRGGLFYAAYEDGGRMDGYVTYRTSRPTLVVNELMAATREANAALWRFCFDMDLITCTEALKRPVDDPMPWMLADPRRLQRSTRDGVWVRLVDVAASLKLRRYMQNDRLVLEVRDELCPWNDGRFELEGSPEGAACRASSSSPDLTLVVSALASAYLGTVSFSTLSQAGLVDERTPGALRRADRMFAARHQPWTPYNF
jgi:predicted acetyltransferase